MTLYRKKPVEIEAVQWVDDDSARDILRWSNGSVEGWDVPGIGYDFLLIRTLEGDMHALRGDYIIKGVQGEFYPCKPDIFHATYEKVE